MLGLDGHDVVGKVEKLYETSITISMKLLGDKFLSPNSKGDKYDGGNAYRK